MPPEPKMRGWKSSGVTEVSKWGEAMIKPCGQEIRDSKYVSVESCPRQGPTCNVLIKESFQEPEDETDPRSPSIIHSVSATYDITWETIAGIDPFTMTPISLCYQLYGNFSQGA